MIRVLVAEDSETARTLLVQILGSDPDILVVAAGRPGLIPGSGPARIAQPPLPPRGSGGDEESA